MSIISGTVARQRAYFLSNATKSVDFRIAQLRKFKAALQASEAAFNEAIYADFKKSVFDTYTNELALLYHDMDVAISRVRTWAKRKRVRTNLVNFPARSYVIPEPLGVSLIIGAWNYPYQLSLAPVVAAIAAGNTVVLKPSELPSHTSAAMAKLVAEHFDPQYFTVIEGGIAETTELLEQKFDKIFFTGSVPVGKIVYQAAAKHLTPVTLELGGKSPAFVTEDCDMDMTVRRLIWAKYLNAGQTCIAPDYVYVHASVEQVFLEKARQEIEASQLAFENDNYVQIINERNLQRLASLIEPTQVYHGGTYDVAQRYMAPTLLSGVTWADKVMADEIFGPILPVLRYENLDAAIAEVKQRPKPLSCYVFTQSQAIRDKILHEISFGGGCVNDAIMHVANGNLAFGGVGESGIGSYHGLAGFQAFTHYKSILDKPTWLETNLKYYPHTVRKLKWAKWLLGLG